MAPSLSGGWLGDDHFLVTEANCNHGIEHIPEIVLQDAGRCNYRPLRHISYAFDFSAWGLEPLGYRATNLLIHLATLLIVLTIFRLLGLSPLFASVGATIFALHPVQTDAVAYISGRRDVLMGLGYALSVFGAVQLSRAHQMKSKTVERLGWTTLAVFGAVISITTKEMGVTVVATIALFFLLGGYGGLFDSKRPYQSLGRRALQYRWLLIALAVPASFLVVWRGLLKPVSTVADTLFGGSLTGHIATVLATHARYAEIIFFPWRLAGDYAPPVIQIQTSLLGPLPILGGLWLGLLVGLSIHFYRQEWLKASFGVAWYLITMLPVSHIIPHHELAAEHYLYIPIVGIALTTASLLQRAWFTHLQDASLRQRRLFALALGVVLALMTSRTFIRAFDYRSETAHAKATVRHFPASVRGRARLGLSLLQEQGFESARPHLNYVLGTSFQGSARTDVLRELGQYFVSNGEYTKGIKLLAKYVSLRPKDRAPLEALSKAFFETRRHDAAHEVNLRLVNLAPKNAEYHYKTALTAWLGGDEQTAHEHVRQALQFAPDHLDALFLDATLIAESNPSAANRKLRHAEQLLQERTDEPLARQRRLLRDLREKLDYARDEFDQ